MESNPEQGQYSSTTAMKGIGNSLSNINRHTVLIIVGVICVFIAIVGFLSLCGYQTGTCETSGVGSLVTSSFETTDGEINPTAEVLSEFLIIMFTVIGVAMLAYVWTISRASKKLVKEGDTLGALMINGKKDIKPEDLKKAEMEELTTVSAKLGIPPNALQMGLQMAKQKMQQGGAYMNRKAGEAGTYMNDQYQNMRKSKPKAVPDDEDDAEDDNQDEDSADEPDEDQPKKKDAKKKR